MSRYLLLLLLNLPFILAGILTAITQYKLNRINRKKLFFQLTLWFIVTAGLIAAEPLYQWLKTTGMTDTDPLSLFDVVQITAIVVLFYVANRVRLKLEVTERRLQDLHQEVSIILSKK